VRRQILMMTVVALAAAVLPSCLEVEKQTILLRRDGDALSVRIIYEGLYSSADDPTEDLATLADTAKSGKAFMLFDPLFAFDLGKTDNPVAALLAKHGKLKNGTFFMADGKLAAWQDLKIERAGEFVAGLNKALNEAIARDGPGDDVDADTKKMILAAAGAGHAWIVLDDAGLHVRGPASRADVTHLKERFLRGFAEDVISAATSDLAEARTSAGALLRTVSANPFSFIDRGTEAEITLSSDATLAGAVRLTWWNAATYKPNLLAPAAKGAKPTPLPLKLDKAMTVKKLVDELTPKKK
jgi:hypothetical protein